MCTNPRQVTYRFDRPSDLKYRQYRYDTYAVRCGDCDECLKEKRQNITVSAYRTALRLPNMIFATFTYNDDSLPIAYRYEFNGSIVNHIGICPILEGEEDYRQKWFSMEHPKVIIDGRVCTVCERSSFDIVQGDISIKVHLTPSLSRKDWRLSLKRQRVRYFREFGESLPKFKYMCVGEYGPRTNRPHFHCLFWNLTYNQASYLFSDWERNFGHVDFHTVVSRKHGDVVDDGKFSCACYVAKYLVKGSEFEYKEALNGFCEKPRKMISKDVGFVNDIEPDLERQLLGFDIMEYDPNCFNYLPKESQEKILSVITKRMYYPVKGRPYSLPLNIKRKLFYDKETLPDGSIRFRPKQVQQAITNFVRAKNDSAFENLLRNNLQKSDSEDLVRKSAKLCDWYEGRRHSSTEIYKKNYISTLQKSRF